MGLYMVYDHTMAATWFMENTNNPTYRVYRAEGPSPRPICKSHGHHRRPAGIGGGEATRQRPEEAAAVEHTILGTGTVDCDGTGDWR